MFSNAEQALIIPALQYNISVLLVFLKHQKLRKKYFYTTIERLNSIQTSTISRYLKCVIYRYRSCYATGFLRSKA